MPLKKFFDKRRDPAEDRNSIGPDLKAQSPIPQIKPEPDRKESDKFAFDPNLESESEFGKRTNPVNKITQPPAVRETGITVLGKDISFKGELRGAGSVKIDGCFEGNIVLDKELTILKNGRVDADIEADYVIIEGLLNGNVTARKKVTVKEEGTLVGDIKTEKIAVDEGAVIKGKIEIFKSKPKPQMSPPKSDKIPEPKLPDKGSGPLPGSSKPVPPKSFLDSDKPLGTH